MLTRRIFELVHRMHRAILLALIVTGMSATNLAAENLPINGEEFKSALRDLAGLGDLNLGPIKTHDKWIGTTTKLHGEEVTLMGFQPSGVSKPYLAVVPSDFKIANFLPIPNGTPLEGVRFKDMAFVFVPKGHAKNDIPVNSLPELVKKALAHFGSRVSLKEGFHLFGQADFSSSASVKQVLSVAGMSNYTLPLSGDFPTTLFQHNIKSASTSIKNKLFDNIRLNLPLPKIKIPGLPSTISVQKARFAVAGRKLKNKRELIAGLTGQLNAKLLNKNVNFNFYILADKSGTQKKVTLKGDTKSKITLPLAEKLELDEMNLVAVKANNKWSTTIKAKTKFFKKEVDVAISVPAKGKSEVKVTTKMTLAEMLGDAHFPGLDKMEIGFIQVWDKFIRVEMTLDGVGTDVDIFKPRGASKYQIALEMVNVAPSRFIPGASKTPLKDVTFKTLGLVYSPDKATKQITLDDLSPDVSWRMRHTKGPFTLKPGLNVFGQVDVHPTGEVAKLLKKVGVTDLTLPLNGKFSSSAFGSHDTTAIKNEIIDNLDLKIAMPKLNMPGISKVAKIRKSVLTIKGVKKGNTRGVDAEITGELDVKIANKELSLDFDLEVVKHQGKKSSFKLSAKSSPGKKITIDLVTKMELTDFSFEMKNSGDKWNYSLLGDTKIGKKDKVSVFYFSHSGNPYVGVNTKMTLAEAIDSPGLPGLDDIEFDWMQIWKNQFTMGIKVKGISSQLSVFKAGGLKKHFISWVPEAHGKSVPITPAQFIPGAEKTPLKDVSLVDMAFVYSPSTSAIKIKTSDLPGGLPWSILSPLTKSSLKPGLNVFGHMKVHPSGEMETLLKKVGVSTVSMPLNGKFSPKAFAKNTSGTAIKNAILDELDLDIKLPTLHVPAVSSFLTFKNGHLKIKGKTPKGVRGIDVAISGDADVHVKHEQVAFNIDVEYDKAGGASDLSFKGHTDETWNHPMGIKFLDLESLSVTIDKKKKKDGTKLVDISMKAKSDVGSHSQLVVTVDVHEKNGKVTDAFFELDGPLKLSDIPGVKDIPNSSHFTIDTIKASEHGIEAKVAFGGKSDLDAYMFTGSGWNLIVRQDNFAITEFVPPLKDTPLKHIVLSEAAMVLSKDGLNGPLSGFSIIAQDALKDIFGANASDIKVDSGLSLIAAFEHKNSKGGVAGALKRMGLSEERVIMTGGIGGLFGGPTQLDVDVDLSAHTGAKSQPKWMKKKPGVTAVFSLIATETAGQFDIEIGIGADITATVHGTELDFTAKTALEFEDEKIDVKIVADLKDKKGWHKPFGIPGFTLYEVGFDLGIDEDGAIHLGFDGDIKVSGDTFKVAADADLLPEALGAPQDIAFKASADKVDMFFMEAIAIQMMGGDFKMDLPQGILPEFTNVKFAFVTPGAQDPDLHITGEGFALAGGMNWLGHELGSMDVAINPKKGITASGKIDNLSLGPLELKNNDFDMKIALLGLPSLKIDSDIEFIGIKERFKVAFSKTGITIDAAVKFGPDFSMTSDLTLSGIDMSVKKPSFKKADFAMKGDFVMDIGKFIAGPAKDALDDVFSELDAGFKDAEKAIKKAEKKVDGLTTKINAKRAALRKKRAAAESKVRNAENRVNGLNGRLSGQWRSYHHCHGWHKWPCRIREGIRIGWTKAEVRVADAALYLAREIISHFPLDLDPEIAILLGERDTAKGVLYLAEKAVEGADDLDSFMKKAVDKLASDLKNSININKASFQGDLRDIITKDAPVDLALEAEFFGAKINDTFAISIGNIGKDLVKDVEKVSLMGIYALEHLVERGIGHIPGPLKSKLRHAITGKLEAKNASNKRDLAKHAKEFAKYNKTAVAMQEANEAYNEAYLASQLAEGSSALDSDKTETFTNEFIEVGHTGLCLNNASGSVKQERCSDGGASRWSTVAASGAKGVKKGAGYVYIQDKDGKCIVPEGSWVSVKESFSDPKLPKEGSFTFEVTEYQGDGKINVTKCANLKKYYWKVLQHGDGWMQLANLATKQCLHFENSSSVPGQSEAEWKPCIGAANQIYRLADKTTPSYHPDNIVLKSTFADACPEKPNTKNKQLYLTNCKEGRRFDYSVDIRGNIKFISRASGKCLQPNSYWNHANVVERTCTQLDYQWWTPVQKPGGWKLQNAQTKSCMQFLGAGHGLRMDDCLNTADDLITPVLDQESGITLADGTSANLRIAPNAALAGTPEFKICLQKGMSGAKGSQVTGVYKDGMCSVWFLGRTFKADKKFKVVTKIKNSEWIDAKGHLPETAISIGSKVGPWWGGGRGGKTAFACRTHSTSGSSVGWTIDGKSCFYIDGKASKSTTFAVLSRTPSKAFMFNFTDSKSIVHASSEGSVQADVAPENDGSCHPGGYAGNGARASNWRDLTFTNDMDAAVNWNNGTAYFFKGSQYIAYNIAADRQDGGYPANINRWRGLSFTNGIDAAVNWGNGTAYFFKGDEYIAYNIAADRQDGGYPKKIAGHWSGLSFTSGIDAAVNWGNGTVYFFKGDEYVAYNIARDRQDPGYPKKIEGAWKGLYGSNINSAVIWKSLTDRKHAYFFKGEYYKRYNIASDCVK